MQLQLGEGASPEAKRLVELTTDSNGNRDESIKLGTLLAQYPELAPGLDEYMKAVEDEGRRICQVNAIPGIGHSMRFPSSL